uniref:ATP synthase subunit epsilon, mitochondrial n=1 Tax=Setaria italica TaxID=4555 RepID=K3YJW5_SETIT
MKSRHTLEPEPWVRKEALDFTKIWPAATGFGECELRFHGIGGGVSRSEKVTNDNFFGPMLLPQGGVANSHTAHPTVLTHPRIPLPVFLHLHPHAAAARRERRNATMSATTAAVPFWRAAGMTYIGYSNICAALVRNCLKEPFKSEAASREKVHFSVAKWADGKQEKPNSDQ